MKEFSMTQEQLSGKIGRSRSHIANFLRLLKLPERVQESLVQEVISMGQAKPLLSLEDNELQQKAANYIIDHELSPVRRSLSSQS
jgi:ParB family chromosome partitioning protein